MTIRKVSDLDNEFTQFQQEYSQHRAEVNERLNQVLTEVGTVKKEVGDVRLDLSEIMKEQPEGSNRGNKGPRNETSFANYTQFEKSDRVRQANRSNHHGVDYQMRKLKILLFDGEGSHGWIYKVERYFKVQAIQPKEHLRAAILCMKGQALSWFRLSEARSPFRSWEGLKGWLLERFQLSQEGTLGHGGNFIKGLRLELRSAVRVIQPEGLNHAMKLAIMIDDNKLNGVVGKRALKPPTGGTMRVEFTTDQVQHVGQLTIPKEN
nr:ankyrin repeat-containing protein [Tanacetum cinerariifolium]